MSQDVELGNPENSGSPSKKESKNIEKKMGDFKIDDNKEENPAKRMKVQESSEAEVSLNKHHKE